MGVRVFLAKESPPPRVGSRLILDSEESHYLLKVRRRRPGDAVELLDGHGGVWSARYTQTLAPKQAELEILAVIKRKQAPTELVLMLGLIESNALATALSHASELGVDEIVFIQCERSQGKHQVPSAARLERLFRATMRQCGRVCAPRTQGPISLPQALALHPQHSTYIASLSDLPAQALPPANAQRRILIGPEGGFTPEETQFAHASGCVPLSLGPWVLRSETAVPAGLALVRSFAQET